MEFIDNTSTNEEHALLDNGAQSEMDVSTITFIALRNCSNYVIGQLASACVTRVSLEDDGVIEFGDDDKALCFMVFDEPHQEEE